MLKNVLYKAALCLGVLLAFAACSQEDETWSGGGNGVTILCRIADSPATRATENGWDDSWKENTIERLDIFQFTANGELKRHLSPSNLPSFTGQNKTFQEVTVNDLTYNELANNPTDVFYLVANCQQLESANIGSEADLQAVMIAATLDVDGKQQSFVMDARTSRDSTELYTIDTDNKSATLRFQLYRAAAKIRVAVNDEEGDDMLDDCRYRLFNYVEAGTSVLAGSEAYGEGDGQSRKTSDSFQAFAQINDSKAVFYSYPNDWFDESKLDPTTGTFPVDSEGEPTNPYASDDLIDETRQTYLMLEAPYTDGNTYYYKVPVNFAIADYNDKDGFTADEITTLRSGYYRINRNSIYDITVTIDRAGGSLTEPVTPQFHIRVNDWQPGGDYNIGQGEFQ